MNLSVKEELIQALDRLSVDELRAVLHFAQSIEQHATGPTDISAEINDEEAERAVADFVAAAGCGRSGDPDSSQRVDEILYGHKETP